MTESVVSRPLSAPAGSRVSRRPISLPVAADRRQSLWRALWSPYWIGAEIPAPRLPTRQTRLDADRGLAGDVVALGLNQIRRRMWIRHALSILVRSIWLGVAIDSLWLVVELAGGPPVRVVPLAAIAAAVLLFGILFAVLHRPSRRDTARMLDQSFALQERLSTAVDHFGRGVPKDGERASVVYLQMADAANAIAELRRTRSLGITFPVRELVLLVFCGLLMAGLFFLRGVGGGIPEIASSNVPAFTPAVELSPTPEPEEITAAQGELAPTVEEVQQRSERSHEAQRDLQTLARALEDHAVTRGAADAIDQGDYEAGANELRDLAPRTDQLSPSAREELARDLDAAAPRMSAGSGDLNRAASEAAAGLRDGGQAAEESVRELGEAVERTGGEIASQQELAEQMQQAEQAAADGQQGEQGASAAGQPGAPNVAQSGEAGVPGEGMPGESSNPGGEQQSGGQPGAMTEPGEGQPGAGGEGGPPGQAPNPEAASGQTQPGGQPGSEGEAAANGEGAVGESDQSAAGGGAGSGDAQAPPEEGQQPAAGDGQAGEVVDAEGVPAEAKVTEGDGAVTAAGDPEPVTETIQLPQGSDGSGIQTVNDAGGSRQGTGAGVTAGSGSAVQGDVGEAGPDSNRVPPDYRSVVERYFSEPEAE